MENVVGLDNFWQRTPDEEGETVELEFDPPLRLCGGMFSEHGSGSFRGNVYKMFVLDATDGEYTLYKTLTPEDAANVALILKATTLNPEDYCFDAEELDDLVRMFEAYAEAGCYLVPWF